VSGKQARRRRQQAAAPPSVVRKGERRRASPKVLVAAALAALVVAGAAVALLTAVGGNDSSSAGTVPSVGSLTNALPASDAVQREFAGIPQQGRVLGSPTAPVTMVEYVDLQCPGCRALETEVMPTIVPELVRTGKLKVEARPLAFIGPDSLPARYAAVAAGAQNKMFDFMQVIYANQGVENTGWLSHAFIEKAAASVPGMQVQRLLDDQKSNAVVDVGKTIDGQAKADNVSETPTLLLGRTGGRLQMVSSKDIVDAARLAAAVRRLGG
jgi:protein-disulfide isomerase